MEEVLLKVIVALPIMTVDGLKGRRSLHEATGSKRGLRHHA